MTAKTVPMKRQQQLMEMVGASLYGERWIAPLARELGENVRWAHRALADEPGATLTTDHLQRMAKLVERRTAQLGKVAERLGTALQAS